MVKIPILTSSGRRAVDDRKYLTQEELDLLFRAVEKSGSKRDLAMFTLAYWRGLRASEVGRLQVADYRTAANRLYVRRLKRSLAAEFPLGPQEQKTLRAWLRERGAAAGPLFPSRRRRGISRQQLDVLMRRYGAAAGIPEHLRHFHTLKHSIATHLLEKGADVAEVRDWIGHANIQNTMIYAQLTNPRRDAAARRIYDAR